MQGVWVPSLVGELRSHMLWGAAKKKFFFFNVKKKNDIFSLVQPKMGQKILWTALTKLFSKGSVGNVRVVEKGSSLRALSG